MMQFRLVCTRHDSIDPIRIGDLGPLNVRSDTVLLRAAWMNAVPNKESGEAAELNSRAFGQADMTFRECPLLRSLLGVKRTSHFALHMSANDPKRTLMLQNHLSECSLSVCSFATIQCPILTVRDDDEAARVHHASQLRGGDLAARCPRAAA
jgi:hypothetical protein